MLLVGTLCLLVGIVFMLGIFIPKLGENLYGKFWRDRFHVKRKKELSNYRNLLFASSFIIMGLSALSITRPTISFIMIGINVVILTLFTFSQNMLFK